MKVQPPADRAEERGAQFIRVKGNKPIRTKGVGKPSDSVGVNPGARAGYRAALGGMSPRSK